LRQNNRSYIQEPRIYLTPTPNTNQTKAEPKPTSNLTLTIRRTITLLTTHTKTPSAKAIPKTHCPTLSHKKKTEKDSPPLPKPPTLIPHPTTRTRRPIAPFFLLRRIPRLHRFRNVRRFVRSVPRESRGDGAVEDVAGDCGVESGGLRVVA
jgi:hypothetical protein